jgi:hypothetical protein
MYMWIIGAALVAVVTVYFRGKADGRHDLEGEIKDKRIDDMLTAKEVEDEIEALDDDMLLDRANKWVRKRDG